jgi:hypothetical protein
VSYILRVIRKSRWYLDDSCDWLRPDEPWGDCLRDLATDEGNLSVWWIDRDRSNLDRVLAALASTRESIGTFDYRLTPLEWVRRYGLTIVKCPGQTADDLANERWHWDLRHLSAHRVVIAARCLWRRGESARLTPPRVERLLRDGLARGNLDRGRMDNRLVERLDRTL